jgi:uncharacterized protein with HEPN domain
MRSDAERLRDMLTSVDRILQKTRSARERFDHDEMLQVWVLHHLQIIGEAARSLTQEFRHRHSEKVWSQAAGLRHILVHHYFEIDAEQVWKVVERDLPVLRDTVIRILVEEGVQWGIHR